MAEIISRASIADISQLYKLVKEYEPKFNKLYKENFDIPLKQNFIMMFNALEKEKSIRPETISLFRQAYQSLESASYLLSKRSLVESMVLMRSAYENIMMGFLINEDDNIYSEFKIISLSDSDRKFTRIRTIRNRFNKKLKSIAPDILGDMNSKLIRKLSDELYDKLCLYTHSSLAVSLFVELKKNNDDKLVLPFANFNLIFIKIILLRCIQYFTNSDLDDVDFRYYILNFTMQILKSSKMKHTHEYFKKYNELLYPMINSEKLYGLNNEFEIQNFIKDFTGMFKDENMVSFFVEVFETNE